MAFAQISEESTQKLLHSACTNLHKNGYNILNSLKYPFDDTMRECEKKEINGLFDVPRIPMEIGILYLSILVGCSSDPEDERVILLKCYMDIPYITSVFGILIANNSNYISKQEDGRYVILKPSVVDSKKVE